MRWCLKDQRKMIMKGQGNIITKKVPKLEEPKIKDKFKALFRN